MQTGSQLPAVPWFAAPAPLSGRAAGEGARAALKPGTPPATQPGSSVSISLGKGTWLRSCSQTGIVKMLPEVMLSSFGGLSWFLLKVNICAGMEACVQVTQNIKTNLFHLNICCCLGFHHF